MTEPVLTAPRSRRRLRAAIVWSYVQTGVRQGMTVLVTFVLAAMLGPRIFGVIALALAPVLIVQALLQQVMLLAIVQRNELDSDHLDAGFWLVMLASTGSAVATAALSPLWAAYNNLPELRDVTLALAPLIVLQGLAVVPEALLRRNLTFRAIAARNIAAATTGGVAGIGLALLGAGVWALVAQQLSTGAVGLVMLWLAARWRPRLRLRRQAARDLAGFSAHSAVGAAGYTFSERADALVMGAFFGPVAVGLFRLAVRLPEMLLEVTAGAMQQVALPDLARLQDDRPAFVERLRRLLHLSSAIGLPMLGVLAGCAPPLVGLLGPDWAAASLAIQVLCLAGAINLFGTMLAPTLQAIGRPGLLAVTAWLMGLLTVGGFALAGVLFAGREPAETLLAITLTKVGVDLFVVTVAALIVCRAVLRTTVHSFLTPMASPALAGTGAFGAALLVQYLLPAGTPSLVTLAAAGIAASGAGAGLLLVTDPPITDLVRRWLGRARSAGAVSQP
jgi:teichuronic acid exporter